MSTTDQPLVDLSRLDIGDIVIYHIDADDADEINRRRQDATDQRWNMRTDRPGFQAHIGEPVRAGDRAAAVVTRRGPNCVSLHVLLDGSDSLWKPDVTGGDGPGQCRPRTPR